MGQGETLASTATLQQDQWPAGIENYFRRKTRRKLENFGIFKNNIPAGPGRQTGLTGLLT